MFAIFVFQFSSIVEPLNESSFPSLTKCDRQKYHDSRNKARAIKQIDGEKLMNRKQVQDDFKMHLNFGIENDSL